MEGNHIISQTNTLNQEAQGYKAEDEGPDQSVCRVFTIKETGNNFWTLIAEARGTVSEKTSAAEEQTVKWRL